MFIQPMNVLRIQEELKRYRELCLQFRYTPARSEFDDIVNFILLQSGSGGILGESTNSIDEDLNESTSNYLFESFMQTLEYELNEKGGGTHIETDGEGNFDTAVGLTHGYAKKGVMAVVGAAALAGLYIAYLMKKGKLKASMQQEHQLEMQKLNLYEKVITIGVKLAKMKGETQPKLTDLTQPALTAKPGMPSNPKAEAEK